MRNRSRFLRTLGLTSLFMVAGAGTSVGQETYKSNGWYKACSDQGENRICNVQYQAVASTGQVIASINVAQISGKLEKRVFQITVPTGRMIPPGMRVVFGEATLLNAISMTRTEARVAFGDDTVYMEKFLERPRHVEFQVLADGQGNAIHLGERDCSMQRRSEDRFLNQSAAAA